MKPNYSLLARELGIDRRTAKKYYEGYEKPTTRVKPSKIDEFYTIIEELLSEDSIQVFHYKTNLYNYLVDMHEFSLSESALRKYLNKIPKFKEYFDKKKKTPSPEAVMRFETEPGEQLQIDWKENFRFLTSDGQTIYLNVLVSLLSYSRYSIYQLSLDRKQETLFAMLNVAFESLGGVPKQVVSDNLKTVMQESRTAYNKGKINEKFEEYSKDFGFEVIPCIGGRASTKGKVETQMKLIDELDAYQGKLNYEELVEHVAKINRRKNLSIHQAIGQIPSKLFQYEKDFLLPLPRKEIRSRYLYQTTVKVNKSSMISYKSNQYSVPAEYIGEILGLEVIDNIIYLYDSTKLVTKHEISNKKLNYHEEHYQALVKKTMPYKTIDEVRGYSKKNLEKIGEIYAGK